MISKHTIKIVIVLGSVALLFLAWHLFSTTSPTPTLTTALAPYPELSDRITADFTEYPLATLENYTLTDTLKDGVDIQYGSAASTTFASADLTETLSLNFPETLSEPMLITLPGHKQITITHNVEGEYTSEFLASEAVDLPQTETAPGRLPESQSLLEADATASNLQYLKYTAADQRISTYYAYQKDQALGYRNLKHWTVFADGDGQEQRSYTFSNAHLKTNDKGEVEVRYVQPEDTSVKAQVGDDLWARAQQVIQQDLAANIEHQAPDLIIPAPYTVDAQGNQVTHEWTVTRANSIDPSNLSNDYVLSVSFKVPLLGYPIALDPTLQFTAPGVTNAGDVIDGEGGSFSVALTTGDYNGDGKLDLAVGANGYNTSTGRAYIFYGGDTVPENVTGADVVLDGETTNNYFGIHLTTGDFDADGVDDLVVGATGYTTSTGRAYVFYGGAMVSENATGADVTITGETTNNYFSGTLTAGDLNGDGTDDLVLSAIGYSGRTGRAYVFYGGSMVSANASAADVIFTGEGTNNGFGVPPGIGDFNADGTDDLVVGAGEYSSNTGRAYIFYGGSMVSENATGADVTITGETTNNYFGRTFTAGDFNHDGKADLVVGAEIHNTQTGRAYIFYGGSITTENASAADVVLTGEGTNNYFSHSFTTGDFNADGTDDLTVGAYGYSSNTGRAYIFYGGNMASVTASAADVILTGELTNNRFSYSLTTGNLNADGKEDLVVGAYNYPSTGRVYIFYSQSGQVNLNQTITGEGTSDYFGSAFAVGDFNSDGRDDLAVGAYKADSNKGKVYIFYNDGDYTNLASTSDVEIVGETSSSLGGSLLTIDIDNDGDDDLVAGSHNTGTSNSTIYIFYNDGSYPTTAASADDTVTGLAYPVFTKGDYDNDGDDDLAVGTHKYSSNNGRAYIFYNDGSLPATDSGADVIVEAEASDDELGYSLATGDFNSDGIDDLAVGADEAGTIFTGKVYVFYGGSLGSSLTAGTDEDVVVSGNTSTDYFGFSLATGDFNDDGKDDLAVGDKKSDVHIFYGGAITAEYSSEADVAIDGDNFFSHSLTTGDFNHDGKDDLAVGSYAHNSNTGRTYLYYGGTFTASMEAATSSSVMITGDSTNDDFGYTLATGDFNHDGKDDLVIGAPGYDNGGDTGRIYFNETRENYAWEIQRSSLVDGLRVDPLMGYEMKITGESTSDSFSTSIAVADLNHDGKNDLIVGATGHNSNTGKVYIFYNDGSYQTKAGRADVVLTGAATGDKFGASLAIGDYNADGQIDLAVGATGYDGGTGRTYIFYGGSIEKGDSSGADVILTGETTNDLFGFSLTTGDFNADGVTDLAAGAWGYSTLTGRTYIFYGGSMVSEYASTSDVILTGEGTFDFFSWSFTTGDFNADGVDDLAVGAGTYDGGGGTGRAYVFYGGSMVSEYASTSDVILTGEGTSNFFGLSLATGDFNDDGIEDLAVGAYRYNTYTGRAYIFYGGSMVTENASGADVTLTGETTNGNFGISLTTGDFNHDGKDDLAVGASGYDVSGGDEGRVYVFHQTLLTGSVPATSTEYTLTGEGASNLFGVVLAAGDLNNDGGDDLLVRSTNYNSSQGRLYFYTTNDRVITGEGTDSFFGRSLAVGDFNKDGKNDLAVGGHGWDDNNTGRVYLFYGGRKATSSAYGADVILTGETTNNYFGADLTTGDFNEDGTDDLVVGAYAYSTNTGRAYIFYGGSMVSENASGADVTLTGETTITFFGIPLTVGDFNADGTDDLVVGSYVYNSSTGRAYIFYGGSMVSENASGADVTLTGESVNNNFGYALTVSDLNADGKDDLAVGAVGYNSSTGRVYIFYGDSLTSKNATEANVTLTGETATDYFGASVTTGDLNNDGKHDLVVGADRYDTYTGRVYIFYNDGRYATEAQHAEVIITGETTNHSFGSEVHGADLSGNGVDDLVISAHLYDVGSGTNEGRVYVLTSEAATRHLSGFKQQGTLKLQGNVRFE